MLGEQQAKTSQDGEKEDTNKTNLVGSTVAAVERNLIIDTLQHCLGNRTHAANILGISIRTAAALWIITHFLVQVGITEMVLLQE